MKLVYCIRAIYNPGGMERVLLNKVIWLKAHINWEIVIVTTDQKQRPPFYSFPDGVRMVDLGINYSVDNELPPLQKIIGFLRRRKLHKQRLTDFLMREHADIVTSLYPSESSFLPSIKDGSKKVLELHFCKFFRLQYGRKGIIGLIDRLRSKQDEKLVRKFDRFVVLTEEDGKNWGSFDTLRVIPNAVRTIPQEKAKLQNKRVIAVGRLDYQKGFDKLIQAWSVLKKSYSELSEWALEIFGQGEWHDMLEQMSHELGVSDSVTIHLPTNEITDEYLESSLLVMSSNYEGFGMVLVEAMACGVPCVAFDCPCGPSEIINHGHNGLLVKCGDVTGLAHSMAKIMTDDKLRYEMGRNALKVVSTYSEETVMSQWMNLFTSLVEK